MVGLYDQCYASRGRIGCNSAGKGQNISCRSDRLECDCIETKVKAGHLFIQMGEVRLFRVAWQRPSLNGIHRLCLLKKPCWRCFIPLACIEQWHLALVTEKGVRILDFYFGPV